MSDATPPRRGRRAHKEETAREAPAEATGLVAPQWRRRLYRIPVVGTIVYVIWPPRKAKLSKLRRGLSWVAAVVAVLGIGMAAYPVAGHRYPFFYRVPVERLIDWSNVLSDLETNRIQDKLEDRFLAMTDPRLAQDGDPLTRIEIPSLGVDTIVVEGTSLRALAAGAGHYPNTPLPGDKGNVGIAGHRTTHGRPFNKIDAMKPGDIVYLTTPIGRFTYTVRPPEGPALARGLASWITTPFDWAVVGPSERSILTLTACHPKGSARQRIVVRAELTDTKLVAGAHKAA